MNKEIEIKRSFKITIKYVIVMFIVLLIISWPLVWSIIDFESFKESGSIEYSADVVWGLQLQIINDQAFTQAKGVSQKRRMIAMAKAASPRKVELVCLKNRYGIASYNCGFLYYPQFDLFTPDPQFKSSAPVCPTPQIII